MSFLAGFMVGVVVTVIAVLVRLAYAAEAKLTEEHISEPEQPLNPPAINTGD